MKKSPRRQPLGRAGGLLFSEPRCQQRSIASTIRSSSHFFLAPPLRNRSTGWAEAEHLGYKAISAPGQYLLVIKYKA